MSRTITIQLQVDKDFYQTIINQAIAKGFANYQDYIKELCVQDSLVDLKTLEKLNKIIEILSE